MTDEQLQELEGLLYAAQFSRRPMYESFARDCLSKAWQLVVKTRPEGAPVTRLLQYPLPQVRK